MAETLVIVESPSKAKTIKKYLPKGYEVQATMGHLVDLPKSRLGVDLENNFEPDYIKVRGKAPLINSLIKEAKKADTVLLATDPDREGEAIAWHVANFLGLDPKDDCRIMFHSITKREINEAIENKQPVNLDLVDSQQARRIVDRIVGYSISPFLWKKVKKGLSAGRVQSVVTRMICDREDEIKAFVPEEYWTLTIDAKKKGSPEVFKALLHSEDGKKIRVANAEEAARLEKIAEENDLVVSKIKKSQRQSRPPLPFTTSTLQQTAYSQLGMTSQRTMRVAQQLYEGLPIKGRGQVGLITYLRTDSTRLAPEAVAEAADFIDKNFGDSYHGASRGAKKPKKNVQDAHEAIRPSSLLNDPEEIKDSLDKDQYRLYKLIWTRMLASQMAPAVYDKTNAEMQAGPLTFRAGGERLNFPGFTAVYRDRENKNTMLPEMEEGEILEKKKIVKEQKFTTPPTRYNEGTLISKLEENGIGRPSTYAPTISTIKNRGYVEVENRYLKPTELGYIVTNLMKDHFQDIVDVNFTADMEKGLDEVASGNRNWKELIGEFYGDFKPELDAAQDAAEKVELKDPESDEICELCGRRMVIKTGRYGKFLACPGFPECKNTKPFLEKTGGKCPKCGGDMIKRQSKKGRTFYSCSNYPECDYMNWDLPVSIQCPVCGKTMFQKGLGKRKKYYCEDHGPQEAGKQTDSKETQTGDAAKA